MRPAKPAAGTAYVERLIRRNFMAADGTPEPAAQRCGTAVARLRTLRNLSRAQLVARLYDQIGPDDRSYERISVAWLVSITARKCRGIAGNATESDRRL